jgi:hypothetical protein
MIVAIVAGPRRRTTSGTTLPGLDSALGSTIVVSGRCVGTTVAVVLDSATRLCTSATHLGHERVEFVLGSTADTSWRIAVGDAVVVAPGLADLAIGTVASHVTGLTTDAADDAGREVLLLGAVVLAMTDFTAVLAGLVLVVTKGTVEGGELTELVALEFVLTFGDGGGLQSLVLSISRMGNCDLQSQ